MSGSAKNPQPREKRSAGTDTDQQIPAGEKLRSRTRKAQEHGKSRSCVSANLTEFGAEYHEIIQGTLVRVETYQNGIWITPVEAGDE